MAFVSVDTSSNPVTSGLIYNSIRFIFIPGSFPPGPPNVARHNKGPIKRGLKAD
jgi:hypothetical protein